MSIDKSVHCGTLWMLRMASAMMRGLDETIKAEYGTESGHWYQCASTAQSMERLVDLIPGAREAVLKDVPPVDPQRRLYEALRDFLASKGQAVDPADGVIIPIRFTERPEIPIELNFGKKTEG